MKLSQKQLENLIGECYLDHKGKNLMGKCPYCGYSEWGISLENNHLWNCYRKSKCGETGNIYKLLKKLGKIKDFLTEHEINIFEKLQSSLDSIENKIDLEMDEIKPPLLWKRVFDDSYLKERGWSDDDFQRYEVGRSKFKDGYITFLVRRGGKIVGYISRSDKSKEWIDTYNERMKNEGNKSVFLRYDNSTSDFSKTLFGIDEVLEHITTTVILVEGLFSKVRTDSNLHLYDCPEIKCCATFGAKFSDEQAELLKLKGITKLMFWFEADVLNKIKPIVAKAATHFNVAVGYLDGKDPGDMNTDEVEKLALASRNWLDFNTSYLGSNLK